MLAGVTRYLDVPGTCVLPIGLTGADAWYPIGEEVLYPVRIVARIGAPIEARVLRERAGGDRRLMMDAVGLAVADQLPPEYRGAYADDVGDLDDARRLASSA
jgi:1-acyl-sn-glycerol-3-phosphate acyltransferase